MPELSQETRARSRARACRSGVAEVTGPSMVPTLCHGDQLLVQYGAPVRPGDVVVLRHPFQQDLLVVKRAVERRDGGWWVLGDNAVRGRGQHGLRGRARGTGAGTVRLRYRPPAAGSALAVRRCCAGRCRPCGRVFAGPVGLQALAGPVGGHVGAGRAAVRAVAPGAVGRGVQVGVAARRRLAQAEPVDAVAR